MIHTVEKSEAGKGVRQSETGSGDAFLKRKVSKLIDVTVEQRSEGNESHSHKQRDNLPDKGNDKCKGPKTRACLACSGNSKETMAERK